jgi:endonuclease/exonuclease/phosphatase (EEP) superfamily protein YafD
MRPRPILLTAAAVLSSAAILFAQSSPWPFPARATPPPSGPGNAFSVAFWNVEWFPGARPGASKAEETRQVASVHRDIVSLAADVIGLAEVRDWDSAGLAVQPLPGFKVDVVSNFPPREGQDVAQQVAITSRLEPMSAWAEMWKGEGPIVPPRGFAFAAYQIAPKRMLLVYALHLKSNRGEMVENIAIREESMRQLLVHMKDMERAYGDLGDITWIVGGDFNTDPSDTRFAGEKTMSMLTDNGFRWSWAGMPLEQRVTLPPDKRFPAACFDHIYYRGVTMRKAQALLTSPQSSDHRAIRAEFALP